MFDPSDEVNDPLFSDVQSVLDPVIYAPETPILKRHHSHELEDFRQLKIPRIADASWDDKASFPPSSSTMGSLDDFILKPATAYASLKQQPEHGTEVKDIIYRLYQSFINMIQDPPTYEQFLDYRNDNAQVLIDTMQNLLDVGIVEQQFRKYFIIALAALVIQSQRLPKRFILEGVTYPVDGMTCHPEEERPRSPVVKGSWEGKAVRIEFLKIKENEQDDQGISEQDWFRHVILWAQLSHKNVLPFDGLCPADDEDYFPGLVTPWFKFSMDGYMEEVGTHRQSLISDVAAGLAYFHDNGLIYGEHPTWTPRKRIFITDNIPPHAFLNLEPHSSGMRFDPAIVPQWPVDQRDKFLEMYHEFSLFAEEASQTDDVKLFSQVHCSILTNGRYGVYSWWDSYYNFDARIYVRERPDILIGHVFEGLDDHMRQLLLDCHVEDHHVRPTAREFVKRLEGARSHWEAAIVVQEHEMKFLVHSARAYMSLQQYGNDDEGPDQTSKLYHSFLDVFCDLRMYGHFLSCRGECAQILIDTMQALLDNHVVDHSFRNIFILALAALALHSGLYPKRFILHNVTYPESEMDNMSIYQTVKGFMGGQVVRIEFEARRAYDKDYWFHELMIWAQLSHDNILPFYGLCPINNEDYFPGVVTPWYTKDINEFLKNNSDPATRRSLISDFAAGMAYLHSNQLSPDLLWDGQDINIVVMDTTPPHACFSRGSFKVQSFSDSILNMFCSSDDKDRFLIIHRQLYLFVLIDHEVEQDVKGFFVSLCQILSDNQPSLTWLNDVSDMYSIGKNQLAGYLSDGLDEDIWQLFQDCKSNTSLPTMEEILGRLDGARRKWEMALAIQNRDTDFIVEFAMAYMLPKQSGNIAEVSDQGFKLYQSFLEMFGDFTEYLHFLNCRGERAQVLIDTMQNLLDEHVVEFQFRNIFMLALAALTTHSGLYPKRLMLHNVTYEESELENMEDDPIITRGLMGKQVVKIEFWRRGHDKTWFCKPTFWAQLSHENVLPFYGLCPTNNQDYFPGLVTPDVEDVGTFLKSNPGPVIQRSLISDIAGGLAYLHRNSLATCGMGLEDIVITDTIPPRAYIDGNCFKIDSIVDPAFEMLWKMNDRENFLDIHQQLHLLFEDEDEYENSPQETDVFVFFEVSFQILTGNRNIDSIAGTEYPVKYIHTGLDGFMWQLLLDCKKPIAPLSAHQIVHRLDQKKETDKLVAGKRGNVGLFLTSALMKKPHYRSLLNCEDHNAQTLLDAFQLLLDTEGFQNRAQMITFIQRLSARTDYFPTRFFCYGLPAATTDEPVASGSFADIYSISFAGKPLCFKVLRAYQESLIKHMQKVFAREAIVWAQLSHPNILPFFGITIFQSRLSFVSCWATNGHLQDYLKSDPDAKSRVLLCTDTAAGVEYLHKNNIVHGDLKGCNVLIDSSGRAYLGDFGITNVTDPDIISWTSQSTNSSAGGTIRWQAPELHESEDTADKISNTKATDVYAWSGVCYEIFTGRIPFFQYPLPATVVSVIIQGYTPSRPKDDDPAWQKNGLNDHIWDLMMDCWKYERSERPDMTSVMSRLEVEKPVDTRPPGEWEENASMRFRNAQNSVMSSDSLSFWEKVEELLLQVIPDIENDVQ